MHKAVLTIGICLASIVANCPANAKDPGGRAWHLTVDFVCLVPNHAKLAAQILDLYLRTQEAWEEVNKIGCAHVDLKSAVRIVGKADDIEAEVMVKNEG